MRRALSFHHNGLPAVCVRLQEPCADQCENGQPAERIGHNRPHRSSDGFLRQALLAGPFRSADFRAGLCLLSYIRSFCLSLQYIDWTEGFGYRLATSKDVIRELIYKDDFDPADPSKQTVTSSKDLSPGEGELKLTHIQVNSIDFVTVSLKLKAEAQAMSMDVRVRSL